MGALNPKITKDSMGVYWLSWTPDLGADGYAFTTPSGSSRTFAPAQSKAKLGNPQEPFTVTIKALDITARAGETASYPEVAPPPPPPGNVPHKGISLGGMSVNRNAADMEFEVSRCADVAPGGVCRIDCRSISPQLDALVGKIFAHGLKPLLIIGGSGRVLSAAEGASVATAAAKRYGAMGATLYETPNEPVIHFWTPAQYADCSRAIYDAVKAVNPSALVAMGAATGGGNGGHGVYDFYSQVIPLMQGKYDAFSVHAYDDPLDHWGAGGSQWDATFGHPQFFPDPQNIVSVMKANGGVKPVWSTESGGPVPKYSEQKQADIAKHGCADTRIEMYLWYTMLDDDVPGFGLLRPDKSQRPAYAAFKAAQ